MPRKSTAPRRAARGAGSVYKEGDHWVATIPDPGRRPIKVRGRTSDDAIANRDAKLAAVHRGQVSLEAFRTREIRTVADAVDYWFNAEVQTRYDSQGRKIGGLQPPTVAVYALIKRKYLTPAPFGSILLIDLQPRDVEDLLAWMQRAGVGVTMQRSTLIRLRTVLKFCIGRATETAITHNVATVVKLPEYEGPRKIAPPDEALLTKLVGAALPDRNGIIVPLTLTLALRKQEVLGLTWGAIDFDARTITIRQRVTNVGGRNLVRAGLKTKAYGADVMSLDDTAIQLLRLQKSRVLREKLRYPDAWGDVDPVGPDQFVFPAHGGGAPSAQYVGAWFTRLVRSLGLTYHFHRLRHDCAGRLLRDGVPLIAVSKHLRHSSIEMTADTYAHLVPELQEMVVATSGAATARLLIGLPLGEMDEPERRATVG